MARVEDTGIYGTEFWKTYKTFQNKMRNIQEKLLKVPDFILKSSVNFLELCSVNILPVFKYFKNLKIFLWKKRRFRLRWDSSSGLSIAGRML